MVENRHIQKSLPEAELSKKAASRVTRYKRTSRTMPMMATTCFEVIFLFGSLVSIDDSFTLLIVLFSILFSILILPAALHGLFMLVKGYRKQFLDSVPSLLLSKGMQSIFSLLYPRFDFSKGTEHFFFFLYPHIGFPMGIQSIFFFLYPYFNFLMGIQSYFSLLYP